MRIRYGKNSAESSQITQTYALSIILTNTQELLNWGFSIGLDFTISRAMKIDIGCGPYKKPGYTGVDTDEQPGVDIVADATSLPFEDGTVDAIHTRNTLEHIPDLFKALSEFYRVSRHGAEIEITVPHFSSYEYWRDLTHLRPFSAFTFDHFDRAKQAAAALPDYLPAIDFEIRRVHLHWWDPWQIRAKRGWRKPVLKLMNGWIEWWANRNLFLCERFWCWHVGGFVLVTFYLRVHKPLRKLETKPQTVDWGKP